MRRRLTLAISTIGLVALLAACTGVNAGPPTTGSDVPAGTISESQSNAAGSSAVLTAPAQVNPGAVPGIATNDVWVSSAINKVDALASATMDRTGIPGMAVAVINNGEIVFAKGYGVREVGKPETVDTDTVFQLASLSKPLGSTVVAKEIGNGTVSWATPVAAHLPGFTLADPYVTQNVTIGDMYSHRSGLPDHAGDLLEDLGYDRAQSIARLQYLPLEPFRAVYNYTNWGLTAAAESVADAAGTDWATLSEKDLYGPLGMTHTSSRFADFQAAPNHAVGHVQVGGNYQAKYVRDPDPESPAGGVSSSVTDVATWLAMVLNGGKAADGTQVVDPAALRAALTPQMRAVTGSAIPAQINGRAGSYGYGFNVGNDASGRVRISHSGAFGQGAGTNFLAIPDLDLGIVVLTNAAPNGTAEGLTADLADLAEFGAQQQDWPSIFSAALTPLGAPVGSLVGETAPASPAPASAPEAYVGTYQNDYYGPATVSQTGSGLTLTLGPANQQFPLTHWDGQVFTMVPTGENAPDGSVSAVTFNVTGDTASAMTIEFYDGNKLGTFRR